MKTISKGHSGAGEWVNVTPKMASEWLNAKNTNNRKLREGVAERYARDMKDGKWTHNPQPIMFYGDDGSLADGQHRLWAVVESGKTIAFYVIHGVEREIALNVDTGLGRELVDNAKIGGYEGYITKPAIAIASFMKRGRSGSGPGFTNAERLELVQKYEEHVKYAESKLGHAKKVGVAAVAAALARAHMHLGDHKRLDEFATVLKTGMVSYVEADKAAIALRNYLLDIAVDRKLDPRDIFLKTMVAIKYFVRGKPLTAIRTQSEEAYPLLKK